MENEKRLIDANALDEKVGKLAERYAAQGRMVVAEDYNFIRTVLMTAPTIDAVEVVHGYWIDSHTVDHLGRIIEHGIDCSVCDSVFKDDSRAVVKHWKERFKVCPFCGAIMDGDGNE